MIGLEYVLKLYEMTQQELADRLGIKQQNVDLWIRDKSRKIPKKHLPKLAEIFNIPEEYFQKELKFYDEEEIQFMKLYGVNSYEQPKYIEIYKDFIADDNELRDEELHKEQNKQNELLEFNSKREELIKSIQKILDLGLGNTNYASDIVIGRIKSKTEELDFIKYFLDIYNDCKDYDRQVLSEVIASFRLFEGKELPYTYSEQREKDFYEEIKGNGYEGEIPEIIDKKSISFIYKLRDLFKAEKERIEEKEKNIKKKIKMQEGKIAGLLSKLKKL